MKINHNLLAALGAPFVAALMATNAPAAVYMYDAILNGASEFPPNASPGTGFAQVNYDSSAHTLQVEFNWSGLLGTTTAAHIHAPTALPLTGTAGVATTTPYFAGFPTGVSSGSYSNTLDLTLASSYNSAFITASGGTTAMAEAALAADIAAGEAYLNIHTTVVGGGEIRGFLVPVPEPSSMALMGLGTAVVAWISRRRGGLKG